MPPTNPLLRKVHKIALEVPPLIGAYRKLRDFSKSDPIMTAAYRKLFERRRLTLPEITPESIAPEVESIIFPALHPLFAGEDAPLRDMLFLLATAKGRQARRILEIGTYRARTTWALHRNCPEARIVSYDIQILDSPYRRALKEAPNVELRHASFADSAQAIQSESLYDLVFVDGSHRLEHVIEDSKLAMAVVAQNGVVVWHDYRHNDYFNAELKVPEALALLGTTHGIKWVRGTTCAVWTKS